MTIFGLPVSVEVPSIPVFPFLLKDEAMNSASKSHKLVMVAVHFQLMNGFTLQNAF